MGLGLAACCPPDGITLESARQGRKGCERLGNLDIAIGVPDELDSRGEKLQKRTLDKDREKNQENVLVFKDDRAPAAAPARESPDNWPVAMDSCAMLNDLDFLTTPEWQTMPATTQSALEEKLRSEAESATPDTAYSVALKSLWHNCPDALEVALRHVEALTLSQVQANDAVFMKQKLEFTRIRQRFVAFCIEFRQSGAPTPATSAALRDGVAEVERRCAKLIAEQVDEQATQLPGLVGKRDTIMLQSRIKTISSKLLANCPVGD